MKEAKTSLMQTKKKANFTFEKGLSAFFGNIVSVLLSFYRREGYDEKTTYLRSK